jgi:HAD superfamily hydrolase (TIGR01509 family)
MGTVRAAIFDMDGLMVDTESLYFQAESEVARRYSKTFTVEVMQKMMGHKSTRSIQIMMESLGITGVAEEIETLRDSLYKDLLIRGIEPMPGLLDLLDWLEDHGYRKAVATSSKPVFKDIVFDHLALNHRFESVITSENVSEGKPSPQIFRLAVRRLELVPTQCIVLEDSHVGLKAAKAAGCFCIIVPNRFTRLQDFSEADLVASDLTHPEIRDLFQKL